MINTVKPKHKVVVAGAQFGALTVMGFQGKLAFCLCKCGNECQVNPIYLLDGTIKTCDMDNYDVFVHFGNKGK